MTTIKPPSGWPAGTATPWEFVKAHQYLYYVKTSPIWTDFAYDTYCKEHGLFGGGGSDSAADYPAHVIKLAEGILRNHDRLTGKPVEEHPAKPRKSCAKKDEAGEFPIDIRHSHPVE